MSVFFITPLCEDCGKPIRSGRVVRSEVVVFEPVNNEFVRYYENDLPTKILYTHIDCKEEDK